MDYDPSTEYRQNQAVAHPAFGVGFVRRIVGHSKVEVVFEGEVKILVMNRPRQD